MPITGIDSTKCINCGECILDCPATLFKKIQDGTVIFITAEYCIKCGHCVTICPEDAILRKDMEGVENYPVGKTSENFVEYDPLLQLFKGKRSMRQFKKEPVKTELLEKVFEAIRYAPSGGNSRIWKFAVVSDPDKIKTIRETIIEEVSKVSANYARGFKIKRDKLGIDPIFFDAPQIIVLYYPPGVMTSGINCGIALTYGMLAAETLGLGTVWIGMAQGVLSSHGELRELIGIKGIVSGVICIGYPKAKYHRFPDRSPLRVKGLDG